MTEPASKSVFSNADAYESYVGRWSRLAARPFIAWLDAAAGQAWLDVGAGTGILTEAVLQQAAPAQVIGIDSSPEYVEVARQRVRDDRVAFRLADAGSLPFETPQFDVCVSGLVLNFLPAPQQAVQGMVQVLNSGGTAAAYVWDYGGQIEMMRHFWDAAARVDPAAADMDSGKRFTICQPDNLRALFEAAGLEAVEVIPIVIETRFKDFDDYWLPFLGAQGSVSTYLRSMSDDTRAALRAQLQRQLPTTDGGAIPLVARAWAVKGRKAASL